ncbi:hypothetical protein [Dactylosporangium sp. NPDC051484]|uniref:hypothetical protein n=1 Tax=Dactylosporangium sp. NPDC051484 TaxID=3154942 RepID=UPI00344BEBD6
MPRNEDLDEDGGNPCDLPIAEFPRTGSTGNTAWARRLLPVRDELRFWQSALVYYAMDYLAATCGLRDKDLACLTPACIKRETKTRPNGETYEVVTMRDYKTKNRMAPQRTTWKVNHRIARIIEVIEEIHHIHGITTATSTCVAGNARSTGTMARPDCETLPSGRALAPSTGRRWTAP